MQRARDLDVPAPAQTARRPAIGLLPDLVVLGRLNHADRNLDRLQRLDLQRPLTGIQGEVQPPPGRTADGQVRNCLFATTETDLRALLRDGSDDDTIEAAWRSARWQKAAGHGINDPSFVQPHRPMSAIGG